MRAMVQRYDQLDSESLILAQQAEASTTYEHYAYIRNRANELLREGARIAAAMHRARVYQCRESKVYFIGGGDPDEYPCRDYKTRFD